MSERTSAEGERGVGVPASPTFARAHLGYVDGLRALAALFVVVHHAFQMAQDQSRIPGLAGKLIRPVEYGHFAVSLFIVISGFSLMLPVTRGDGTVRGGALGFFRRRARRILPPYYVAMMLTLATFGMHPEQASVHLNGFDRSVTWFGIGTHLILLHNFFPDTIYQINNVFWSIAVEWQIYFAFPLLVFLWRRVDPRVLTVVSIVAGYTATAVLRHTFLEGLTPHYFGLFVMGMAAAAIATSPEGRWVALRERVPWAAIACVLAAALLAVCYALPHAPQRACDLAVGVWSMAILILPLREPHGRLRRFLGAKPIVFLGGFAYSLYLMHVPFLRLAAHARWITIGPEPGLTFARLMVFAAPPTALGCYLFFLAFERPFMSPRQAKSRAVPSSPGRD